MQDIKEMTIQPDSVLPVKRITLRQAIGLDAPPRNIVTIDANIHHERDLPKDMVRKEIDAVSQIAKIK